jgi:hypothetical protein
MIEIAPTEYWKRITMEEAKLYCFSLNIDGKIGWRLPTEREYYNEYNIPMLCWNQDSNVRPGMIRGTVPVRDLKDD